MMSNLLLMLVAFTLVLLNAFFVAAEFGMVKLRNTRVAAMKNTHGVRGRILAYVHQHLDAYLSACQLGITFASLGLGWVGEPAFAALLRPFFLYIGVDTPELITVSAFFVAFILISFLHIVVGELMPKSLAIRQSENVSLWTAVPLYIFYWVMYPVIWVLNTCSNSLLKIIGFGATHHGDHFYSTDEIKLILNGSYLHGELTKDESKILEHTLYFSELKVTEVMRHHDDMVILDINQPMPEVMGIVMGSRYSRYPVFDKTKNEVIGIIHVKDLFTCLYQHGKIEDLQSLVRPVLKVSYRLPSINLLRKFREGMPHFALVYRGSNLTGFITLDNLLQVLIGRIKDEFHRTQDDWHKEADGSLVVRGNCSIFSLERALDRDIDIGEEEIETIAGLILHEAGCLPHEGQRFEFNEFTVDIEKLRGHRITQVRIYPKPIIQDDDVPPLI